MNWRRWRLGAHVSRPRVARAATALVFIRAAEGLAAWLFFNEFFLEQAPRPLAVQAAFVGYLLLGLLVGLSYRRGRVTAGIIAADIAASIALLAVPIANSGGWASPLVLLFPLRALHWEMVFSGRLAVLYLLAAAAMLGAVQLAGTVPWFAVVPLDSLDAATVRRVFSTAVVGLLIGAPATTAWLHRVLAAWKPRPAPERGDREAGSAVVANALLTVSEAVSRLTRLDEILERVVEIAPRSLDVDYCGIALWEEDTGRYTGKVAAGVGPTIDPRFAGLELAPEEVPDFEWVRRLGHCAVVPAAETLHSAALDVPAVLISPLRSGEQFFGVMEFARRGGRPAFTQRDFSIADGIARQTAVALERARLVEDSRRLVLAVQSTEESVLITDARRRIVFANQAFLRMFGYRGEEIMGSDAMDLAGPSRAWIGELSERIQRRSWRGEAVVHNKDGTPIPIMLNASLIRDDDERVQGSVVILEDISAEKAFQEQMQRADRLAAVGETAAGIAHEINNALAAIFGQTDPDSERSAPELRAALGRVDGQARRIQDIVQGVLEFARPRPPRAEPVDLAAITAKTLELIRRDCERQGVRLETTCDSDLPRARIDPQQVQQVLLNLCRNALQAMTRQPDGWLRVEVSGVDDRLAVRVIDGGPGIPADLLPRIFDPFFSTKAEGSGLGLSVSYAIARAHGGDLQVTSEVGRGTTFTLLLPIPGPEAAPGEGIERVLLVDDDPDVAEALAAMLVKEGLQVTRAATGAEALEMVAADTWDAVFLDVRLPDLSGPEVYARLLETHPTLAQRAVFVTGGVWRSESRLRHELPATQPVLAKPCTQEQVRDVLRLLRTQRQAA